jgi:hypothetical protein
MMTTVAYLHNEFSPGGVPYIAGTQAKVVEVVLERLAYHYNHQAGMDREIDEQLQEVEQIKASLGKSPICLKLKAMGRLP